MRKIIIFSGRYLPGHKDGGPLRTIINVTDALGEEYDFHIACLDRDHGDTEAYPNIRMNEWNQVGNAKVWYVQPGGFSDKMILKLIQGMDCIYLTSFYDDYGYKTLLLKRKGKISQPIYLASMGVFSTGALTQKALKKKVFITGCKALGLFNNITWSVTSEIEAEDMKRVICKNAKYIIAEDLPRTNVPGRSAPQHEPMKVAFLSRISPKKNLLRAIEELQKVKAEMKFTIYGPVEDQEYWRKCQNALKLMPNHVTCEYAGDVPTEKVQDALAQNDVFFFPTLGENYGHVIFEALSVGCIPVISDQTPWHEITSRKAGYELQLDGNFASVLDELATRTDREILAEKSVQIAKDRVEKNRRETGYRTIFG